MASRTGSLPRNENDRLETPPEICACGRFLPDPARRLDEVDAVIVVLLEPGRDREDVGIEDDVLGREIQLPDQDVVGALADLGLARERVGLARFVERHHHDGGAMAPRDLRPRG